MGWFKSIAQLFPHRQWALPHGFGLSDEIWGVLNLPRDHSATGNTHTNNTHSDRCIVEHRKVWACMHACLCLSACAWGIVTLCVHVWVLCIFVSPVRQTSAEEPRPLINSDEWLEIASPTPLSLSESFYLSLQGIVPCDVASVLLS